MNTQSLILRFDSRVCCSSGCLHIKTRSLILKGKSVLLQAWSGPEGSRKLRFPDYMTTAQDGGKVVSPTHRATLPPGNAPGTRFCQRLSRPYSRLMYGLNNVQEMGPFDKPGRLMENYSKILLTPADFCQPLSITRLQDTLNSVHTSGKVVVFTKPRLFPFSILSRDLIVQTKRETKAHKKHASNTHTFSAKSTAVAQWLRCCATNRKVAGSIPAGAIGIFH